MELVAIVVFMYMFTSVDHGINPVMVQMIDDVTIDIMYCLIIHYYNYITPYTTNIYDLVMNTLQSSYLGINNSNVVFVMSCITYNPLWLHQQEIHK